MPADGSAGQWVVSRGGGFLPRSSRDGRTAYYLTEKGLDATPVQGTSAGLAMGQSRHLFDVTYVRDSAFVYEVDGNGERFLFITADGDQSAPANRIHVAANWMHTLPP